MIFCLQDAINSSIFVTVWSFEKAKIVVAV